MTSLLDELRAMDNDLRATATKELDVAGSGGRFTVRYRPPEDRDALTPVLAALNAGGALDAATELQLIVDCCDEILVRGETPDGGPLRFDAGDERWKDVPPAGKPVKTARDCVAKLFRLDLHPLAAARHVGSLVDWLQGVDADIAQRVEGNSVDAAGS